MIQSHSSTLAHAIAIAIAGALTLSVLTLPAAQAQQSEARDVLDAPALANQGFTETNRVLNSLVPSFDFPQPSSASPYSSANR